MTQRKSKSGRRERRISVRAVRRENPDVRRFNRAMINQALQQAADEAAAQAEARRREDQPGA